MFDTMKVAHTIKNARIARNMTQMNLADAMEVSYQAVSNWERGNSMPDIAKLESLCQILHISMEELLGTDTASKALAKIIVREENAGAKPVSSALITPEHIIPEAAGEAITMEEIQEAAREATWKKFRKLPEKPLPWKKFRKLPEKPLPWKKFRK